MNVVYSSDNGYCRHAGISITSLFENNQQEETLNVFMIEYGISEENKRKLNDIAEKYNRRISYLSFTDYEKRIYTDNCCKILKNAYARLYLSEMLPEDVRRAIWLDCDTVIADSLADFWNMDLQGKAIAGVQDCGGDASGKKRDQKNTIDISALASSSQI